MKGLIVKVLLATVGAGLVMAFVAIPALRAQDRAPGESQLRRVQIDGLGGSIGATVRDVTADEGQRAKLSPPEGAMVTRVESDGPAAKAGIMNGDIVVEFDGERVRSARQLSRLVRESPDGRAVRAAIVRDGNRRTLDLTPDSDRPWFAMPDLSQLDRQMRDLSRRFEFDYDGPGGRGWGGWIGGGRARLGVSLTPVSDQLASYFGVQRGVLVSSVDADSPAARAGLKAGDVITSVNGRGVDNASDVLDEVRRADSGASIAIVAMRDRKEVKLTAKMPEAAPNRPIRSGRSI
jgi:serine protease Do